MEELQDPVILIRSEDHPLRDSLPDSPADRLPRTNLELTFSGEEELQHYRYYGQHLGDVRVLCFFDCSLTETDWQAILRHRQLEELTLCRSPVTDAQLSQLPRRTKLRRLEIAHVPVTDALLLSLASLSSLDTLKLKHTQVTLEAIEAFDAAHPAINIAWRRPLTTEETAICDELQSLGMPIEPIPEFYYIARHYRWQLGFPKETKLTPDMFELLKALDGTVERLYIQGSLRPAVIELLDKLPTINSIILEEARSLGEIEQLATRDQTETLSVINYPPDMPEDPREVMSEEWEFKIEGDDWPLFLFEDYE